MSHVIAYNFSTLSEQVNLHCQKVKELQAYLGGEIPGLGDKKRGSTWKEEREQLHSELQVSDNYNNIVTG